MQWAIFSATFSAALANFYFATAPGQMKFSPPTSDEAPIKRSEIPNIIDFVMMLPSRYQSHTETWQGMEKVDIFNPPQANLLITLHVPIGHNFHLSRYVRRYETDNSAAGTSPVLELNRAIAEEYGGPGNVKMIMLQNQFGDASGSIDTEKIRERIDEDDSVLSILPARSSEYLDESIEPDVYFFGELQMLLDSLKAMEPSDKYNIRQSLHVVLMSIDHLVQVYGKDSSQVREALALLEYYIPHYIESASAKFHGQLLCEVDVIEDAPEFSEYLVRHSRSLLQEDAGVSDKPNATTLNLAEPVSEDFAVVFNIVLWLMVGFFLAVFAAAYLLWFMDPGKDNIIYRVTSQRIKSD